MDFGFQEKCRISSDSDADLESVTSRVCAGSGVMRIGPTLVSLPEVVKGIRNQSFVLLVRAVISVCYFVFLVYAVFFSCFWLSVPVQLIAWKDSSPK